MGEYQKEITTVEEWPRRCRVGAQDCKSLQKLEKAKKWILSWSFQEGTQPRKSRVRLLTYRNERECICVVLKPPNLWSFALMAIESTYTASIILFVTVTVEVSSFPPWADAETPSNFLTSWTFLSLQMVGSVSSGQTPPVPSLSLMLTGSELQEFLPSDALLCLSNLVCPVTGLWVAQILQDSQASRKLRFCSLLAYDIFSL